MQAMWQTAGFDPQIRDISMSAVLQGDSEGYRI